MNMNKVPAYTSIYFYKYIKKIPQILRFYPIKMDDSDTVWIMSSAPILMKWHTDFKKESAVTNGMSLVL